MKAAANGILNLSILDGWWDEGCQHGENGWQFGDGYMGDDAADHDLAALQTILTNVVIPTYYQDKAQWITMMRAAINTAVTRFSASRMLNDYYGLLYK